MARQTSKISRSEGTEPESYFDKVGNQVESNQSKLTMVLGGLIILVIVILLFNYFNRSKPSVGPSQQTEQTQEDVSPENLPGKYTVKEGDSLFTIADKYYKDGYKYTEIVQANNLSNPDNIEVDQQLEIPKLADSTLAETVMQPPTPSPEDSTPSQMTGGTSLQEEWGAQITGDSYTVVEGDWLSKIAARAYNGDLLAYTKLAQANNIQNPDLIYPGTVLKIPR